LASHGIAVGRLRRGEEVEAQPLAGGAPRKQRLAAGSWAVTTAQPLGALAAALLERQADLPEAFLARQRERAAAHLLPEFYDVTAWSLPLAYNVRAWTTAASVAIGYDDAARTPAAQPAPEGRARVGYLVPPAGLSGYRLAA